MPKIGYGDAKDNPLLAKALNYRLARPSLSVDNNVAVVRLEKDGVSVEVVSSSVGKQTPSFHSERIALAYAIRQAIKDKLINDPLNEKNYKNGDGLTLSDWVTKVGGPPPSSTAIDELNSGLTRDMFEPYLQELKKLNISVFTEREPCSRPNDNCGNFLSKLGIKSNNIWFCVEYDKQALPEDKKEKEKFLEKEKAKMAKELSVGIGVGRKSSSTGLHSFFSNKKAEQPLKPSNTSDASSSSVVRNPSSTDTVVAGDAKTDDPGASSSVARNPINPGSHDQSKPPLKDPPVGLRYQSVGGNEDEEGHCLFIAVGLYLGQTQEFLRNIVAANIEHNLEQYGDIIQALSPGKTPEQYVEDLRNGREWADNIEIAVLMKMLDRPIVVVGPDGMVRNLADLTGSGDPIFVQYNGHTHYDALLLTGEKTAEEVLEDLRQLTNPQNLQPQHPGIPVLPMLPPRPQAPITSPFFPVPAASELARAAVTPPSDDRRRVVHVGTGKPTDTKDSRTKIAQDEARKEAELRRAEEERRAPKRSAPESSSSDSDDSSPGSRPPSPTN